MSSHMSFAQFESYFVLLRPLKRGDAIVLRALSLMLIRLSRGSLPKNCNQLEDMVDSFYYTIQQMARVVGKVNCVCKLDLRPSARTIPIHVVEERINELVGDSSI